MSTTNDPMETEDGNNVPGDLNSSNPDKNPEENVPTTSAVTLVATDPAKKTKENDRATTNAGNNETANLMRELEDLISRGLAIDSTAALVDQHRSRQISPQPGGSRPNTTNTDKIKKKWRRGNRAGRRVQDRKKIRYEAELILAASDNRYGVRSDLQRGQGGRRQWRGRRGRGGGKFNN